MATLMDGHTDGYIGLAVGDSLHQMNAENRCFFPYYIDFKSINDSKKI